MHLAQLERHTLQPELGRGHAVLVHLRLNLDIDILRTSHIFVHHLFNLQNVHVHARQTVKITYFFVIKPALHVPAFERGAFDSKRGLVGLENVHHPLLRVDHGHFALTRGLPHEYHPVFQHPVDVSRVRQVAKVVRDE